MRSVLIVSVIGIVLAFAGISEIVQSAPAISAITQSGTFANTKLHLTVAPPGVHGGAFLATTHTLKLFLAHVHKSEEPTPGVVD